MADITAREAFNKIASMWLTGRHIVPLFGSGISVESGIPTTGPLTTYLAWLKWYVDYRVDRTSPFQSKCVDYLTKHGWPEPHDLAAKLLFQHSQGKAPPLGLIADDVLTLEKLTNQDSQWRILLNRVTLGHQELKDSFFDCLERGRIPSTSHQFAAFVANLTNCPAILTTNFDTFLDESLRSLGLDPRVYELPEEGPIPDAQLIHAHFSLVKMHGGAFGRRMSESLDFPIRATNRDRFISYVPSDALVLVIGYGGGDRRVTSLIESLLRPVDSSGDANRNNRNVLWVYRDGIPDFIKDLPTGEAGVVNTVHYRDGARFLQELFCRLTTAHPVTSTSYEALTQTSDLPFYDGDPGSADKKRKKADEGRRKAISQLNEKQKEQEKEPKFIVFHHKLEGMGTSSLAACAVESAHGFDATISCDMAETSTVESLVAHLEREFRRYDPGLPPFSMLCTTGGRSSVRATNGVLDIWIRHIVDAMQRGKYVVFFDSLGEFRSAHVADHPEGRKYLRKKGGELSEVSTELHLLHNFLKRLARQAPKFVESRVYLAHTILKTNHEVFDSGVSKSCLKFIADLGKLPQVDVVDVAKFLDEHKININKPRLNELSGLHRTTKAVLDAALPNDANTGTPADHILEQVDLFWNADTIDDYREQVQTLLAVLSVFRRPRSIVAIRRLVAPVFRGTDLEQEHGNPEENFANLGSYLSYIGKPAAERENSQAAFWNKYVDQTTKMVLDDTLDELCRTGVLRRQEGGFYWMHRLVRDAFYKRLFKTNPAGAAKLHDLIATYYYEHLFRPSNDTPAFFEYVFHRIASIRNADAGDRNHRMRELAVVLDRERDHVLTNAPLGLLVPWIRYVRDTELEQCDYEANRAADGSTKGEFARLYQRLRRILCELEAEALRQAGLYLPCMKLRLRQACDRIVEGAGAKPQRFEYVRQMLKLRDEIKKSQSIDKLLGDEEFNRKFIKGPVDVLKQTAKDWFVRPVAGAEKDSSDKVDCWLRLVDHLTEFATSLIGIGRRNALMSAKELLRAICRQVGRHEKSFQSTDLRQQFLDARIRCEFRLMDACLDQLRVSPGNKPDKILEQAEKAFSNAQSDLQGYTGYQGRNYFRYQSMLNTLRARVAYLRSDPQFSLAYAFLNSARSAIRRPVRGSEKSSVAICLLHQAECLTLHATTPKSDSVSRQKKPRDSRSARAKLQSASVALNRAERLMLRGRPHVWAWRWYYVLRADVELQLYLLNISSTIGETRGQWEMDSEYEAFPFEYDPHLLPALRAVRAGLDATVDDPSRSEQLLALWRRICIANVTHMHLAQPAEESASSEDQQDLWFAQHTIWENLVNVAGLHWHYKQPGFNLEELVEDCILNLPTVEPKSDAITRKLMQKVEKKLSKKWFV